jgi:glycosyltransferase A (GT-A) superfamily protein (DUF2064 family)
MSAPVTRSVVLFCRAPEAEARAKGLAPAATAVFEAFLRCWAERAAAVGATVTVVAPLASLARLRRLLPQATCIAQVDGAFATRLSAAVADLALSAVWPVVIAGGDAPPPPLATLTQVFRHLEAGDGLALVPADDGGVNAFGLSRPADSLIDAIDWLTPRVGRQLAAQGTALGLRVLTTASGPDLDSARDATSMLRATRRETTWRQFRSVLRALLRVARTGATSPARGVPRLAWPDSDLRGPPASHPA